MKRTILGLCAALLLSPAAAWSRAADTYQVTGQVVSVDADLIVVMKGKEKFEINRDAGDKTDVKVGDKVTVRYKMTATSIEVAKPATKK
jgi:hypothetical protein